MRRPDSQVTVKALEADEPQVEFGVTKLQPEVVLAHGADTAHRFWLGKVNVTVALARGQISARGPVARSSSSCRWSSPCRRATSPSSKRPGARTSRRPDQKSGKARARRLAVFHHLRTTFTHLLALTVPTSVRGIAGALQRASS